MKSLNIAVGVLGIALSAGLVVFAWMLLIWGLAKINKFFTTGTQGWTKPIVLNDGTFVTFEMWYDGHDYRGNLGLMRPSHPPHKFWEVMTRAEAIAEAGKRLDPSASHATADERKDAMALKFDALQKKAILNVPLLRGIRWIGIPPFKKVDKIDFTWAAVKHRKRADGTTEPYLDHKEEPVSQVVLQNYTYGGAFQGMECQDNIPLKGIYSITGSVINPFVALYMNHKWLDTMLSYVENVLRDHIGRTMYGDLRTSINERDGGKDILFEKTEELRKRIRDEIGFEIVAIQILSVDPDGPLATEFVESTTKVYTATQKRLELEQLGAGEAAYADAYFKKVKELDAENLAVAQAIRDSKLTTLVVGQNGLTGITLNPNQPPPGSTGSGT